jgi:hypothetical protein
MQITLSNGQRFETDTWEELPLPGMPVPKPVPPMWDRGHARDGYGSSDHPIHDDFVSDGHDTYCYG